MRATTWRATPRGNAEKLSGRDRLETLPRHQAQLRLLLHVVVGQHHPLQQARSLALPDEQARGVDATGSVYIYERLGNSVEEPLVIVPREAEAVHLG